MNRRIFSISIVFTLAIFINVTTFSAQNQPDINQLLRQAVAEGNLQQVQSLISNGANINATNQLGWTALHAAIRFQHNEIVTMLVNSQADVNAKENSGQTPLLFAVESGQKEIVDLLLENGADVNITNNQGESAFSLAQKIGQIAIANDLREKIAATPGAPNPSQFGNRRGIPQVPGNFQDNRFPDMTNMRRGGPGQNNINPNLNVPGQMPNIDTPGGQPEPAPTSDITLDPNEVKARIITFEGLEKAIQDVADNSRSGMRQWRRTEEDNRNLLASAVRRQYEAEVVLIQKTAEQEKALKTTEAAESFVSSRKDLLRIITREVRDQIEENERQGRTTTTASRRSGRTTTRTTTRTSTRGSRGRNTINTETQQLDMGNLSEQEQESKYDPETQSEIDLWMDADVENLNGRIDFMDTINNQVISDINSIRQIANEETANKTIAAIDGLLIARQQRFDELRNEFEQERQQQQEMPDTMTGERGQMMNAPAGQNTTGRRRGR